MMKPNLSMLLVGVAVSGLVFPASADYVESYEIASGVQENISAATYKDLSIRGVGVLGGVTASVTNRLAIGGTAEKEAKLQVSGGWWPNFSAFKTIIGDNGGRGLLDFRQANVKQLTFDSIVIDANAVCTPSTEYVDFIDLKEGNVAFRKGISNNSSHPARIKFSESGTGSFQTGSAWGATVFCAGDFVMEGCATHPVTFKIVGGGSGYVWSWYYSKLCDASAKSMLKGSCDALFYSPAGDTVASTLHGLELGRLTCANTGNLILSNLVTKLTGRVKFENSSSALVLTSSPLVKDDVYFNFNGYTMTGRVVRVKSGDMRNTSANGGLVFAPAAQETAAFSGKAADSLKIVKDGAGALDISEANILGELTVREGSVVLTADASCATLKLNGGAVTVDGCELEVGSWQQTGGTVTCVNGGKVVRTLSAADSDNWLSKPTDVPTCVTFRKTGPYTSIVYDPAAASGIDVREGVLRFSAYGRTEKYLRILFSKMSTKRTADLAKPLTMGKVAIFGADGTIPSDGVTNSSDGTKANNLSEKRFAYTAAKTTITTSSYWMTTPNNVFVVNQAMNNCCILASPNIDPDDPSTRFGYVIRLAASSSNISGYDFSVVASNYDYPTDWTVEASATGEDGTWTQIDSRTGQAPEVCGYNWWKGGEKNQPTQTFELPGTYVTAGVTGLGAAIDVRVDGGATADFTAVTGGQPVNAITVDAAKGGGTLINAKIAENGVLNIINATSTLPREIFPLTLTLTQAANVENFGTWQIVVNGVPQPWKLHWGDGQLYVRQYGTVLLFW